MVALILSMILQSVGGDYGLRAGAGFYGYSRGDTDEGLKTLSPDSLLIFPLISVTGEGFGIRGVARTAPIHGEEGFQLIHGSAGIRLPGSPWIGAGAAYGADPPFLFGLARPWREWDNSRRDSLVSVSLQGGGVLGFSGSYTVFHSGGADTLTWTRIRSPWLGFAQFWWDGFRGEEERDLFTGFLAFPGFSPWFSFGDSAGVVTGDGEVRGINPLVIPGLSLMAVPRVHYSNQDSTMAGVNLLLSGTNTAQAGMLALEVPVQGRGSPGAGLRYSMQSEAGIHWDARIDWGRDRDFQSGISGLYSMTPAGFGMGLESVGDSLRASGRALYSPVAGVSAETVLSLAVFRTPADPRGSVKVSATRGPLWGMMGYDWKNGVSTVSIELRGWMGL